MSHYLDIQLLRDPEFTSRQLMSALYGKLHRGLVQLGASTIGVSFPGYDAARRSLGEQLRLIGPPGDLDRLMCRDWLRGLLDHMTVSPISAVPEGATHRALRRVQAKSNPERVRRRQMKRHGFSETEVRALIPDSAAQRLDLPFVQLASSSTGQPFRLYLRLGDLQVQPVPGGFNAYGLSGSATVPWF